MPNKNQYILEVLKTLTALNEKEKRNIIYGRNRKETFEGIREYILNIKNIILYDHEKKELLKEINQLEKTKGKEFKEFLIKKAKEIDKENSFKEFEKLLIKTIEQDF